MNEAIAKELFDQDAGKIPDKLIAGRNWKLYSREFPVLDIGFRLDGRSEMRVRLTAKNWNDTPPSVALLDSEGNFLIATQLPKSPGTVFNGSAHPSTGHPFVCMAGTLEYHTHSSHVGDVWDNYKRKDSHTLGGITTQIWNSWVKG
jgi:hypothetical protein